MIKSDIYFKFTGVNTSESEIVDGVQLYRAILPVTFYATNGGEILFSKEFIFERLTIEELTLQSLQVRLMSLFENSINI